MGEYYAKDMIESDPIDSLAWLLSEMHNDRAPIGWTRYRGLAHLIARSDEFRARYEKARESKGDTE